LTLYTNQNWNTIIEDIHELTLPQKLATVTNCFMLVFGCHQDIEAAMNLTSALQEETLSVVWSNVLQQWSSMGYLWQEYPVYGKYENYMTSVVEPAISLLTGWNTTTGVNANYTSIVDTVLFMASYFHVPSFTSQAQILFQNYIANKTASPINSNIKNAVFWSIVSNGGQTEYNQMMQLYLNTEDPSEANSALQALYAPRDAFLCQETLQLIEQNNASTLISISQAARMALLNVNCRIFAWKFIENQLSNIFLEYGQGEEFEAIPDTLLTFTSSELFYNLLQDYFVIYGGFYDDDYMATTLKKAQRNLSFIQCNEQRLEVLL